MRSLVRVLLVAVAAHAVLLAAPALGQSQDNTAVAVNTKDGKSVFKLAFSVKKTTGEVDASNTAVAYASCTDCKTVAAAIQVVLVSGEVTSADADNLAISINYECTECETLAAAYQFVYGDGQELQFTDEGKKKLHELKRRFHDLKHQDLTLGELAAAIAVIAAEVADVVDNETEVKKASADTATSTTLVSSTTTLSTSPSTTTTVAATSTTIPSSSSTTTTSSAPASTSTTAVP